MNLDKYSFINFYFTVVVVSAITVKFFKKYSAMVIFFLLLGIPILILKKNPENLGYRKFIPGLIWGICTTLLILPLYGLVCSRIGTTAVLLHRNFLNVILFTFTVAVAEETFFRGYLYLEIPNEPFLRPISKANFVSSILFATAHAIVYCNPLMFKVFFPSLVMGYVYEKSGSIGAPIIFHWSSNIIYQFIRC